MTEKTLATSKKPTKKQTTEKQFPKEVECPVCHTCIPWQQIDVSAMENGPDVEDLLGENGYEHEQRLANQTRIEFTEADVSRYVDKPWGAVEGLLTLLDTIEPDPLEAVFPPNAAQCIKWTVDRVSSAFLKIGNKFYGGQGQVPFTTGDLEVYRKTVMPLITIAALDTQHQNAQADHAAVEIIRNIANDFLTAIHDLDSRLAEASKGGARIRSVPVSK